MADNLFECRQAVERKYPDDMNEWPDIFRLSAYAARDRLLKREPDLSVISERSHCFFDSSDERWPLGMPVRCTHVLVYEVKLSFPISADEEVGDDQKG